VIKTIAAFAVALSLAACATQSSPSISPSPEFPAPAPAGEQPISFTANSGDTVQAFSGSFEVPENRSDPHSRTIPINYVRFPATGSHPGSPIVYLAGGPGASGIGTARWRRFPLFMAMREFGDVIALDQRGVGESDATPPCTSSVTLESDRAYSDAEVTRLYRQAAAECGAFWQAQGVDLAGYTTRESVQDLDALRRHLGADTITLWGISYGSHLALAALNDIEDHVDRVIIASAEGLDQTVKLPAETDAFFARLQTALDADPTAAARYPDVRTSIRRVHARLSANPVMLHIPQGAGEHFDVLLTANVLQNFASGLFADPSGAVGLVQLYAAIDADDMSSITALLARHYRPNQPISFKAMPLAMDVASGISNDRLALVENQARTALFGLYVNFPMPQLRNVLGLEMDESFRTPPLSDIPTLLFTGTLDGRTYIAEQTAAVSGLSNLTQVMVRNAGHNLYTTSPEVLETMRRFMRGEAIDTREIIVAPPKVSE
jgi:pimeloyl-ACP methyl ester carboxylesterase